jgi:hypothetical protein
MGSGIFVVLARGADTSYCRKILRLLFGTLRKKSMHRICIKSCAMRIAVYACRVSCNQPWTMKKKKSGFSTNAKLAPDVSFWLGVRMDAIIWLAVAVVTFASCAEAPAEGCGRLYVVAMSFACTEVRKELTWQHG